MPPCRSLAGWLVGWLMKSKLATIYATCTWSPFTGKCLISWGSNCIGGSVHHFEGCSPKTLFSPQNKTELSTAASHKFFRRGQTVFCGRWIYDPTKVDWNSNRNLVGGFVGKLWVTSLQVLPRTLKKIYIATTERCQRIKDKRILKIFKY